jgi:hypothetical protein
MGPLSPPLLSLLSPFLLEHQAFLSSSSAQRIAVALLGDPTTTGLLRLFSALLSSITWLGLGLLREPFLKLSLARRRFLAAWEGLLGRELNCNYEGRKKTR